MKNAQMKVLLSALAILSFHLFNNYIVNRQDKTILAPDEVYYYSSVQDIAEQASSNGIPSTFRLLFKDAWKPPFHYVASAPFVAFKKNIKFAALVNILYLGLSMASIYGICVRMFSPRTGVLAMALFGLFPAVFSMSRVFYIEPALTAMVTLTAYIFALNRFDVFRAALLAGLVMGLGMLTKQPYFMFLIPLLVHLIARAENLKDPVRMRNIIIALALGLVLAAPWYLQHGRSTPAYYGYYIFKCDTDQNPWFYLEGIYHGLLFPVFTVLTGGAFIYFIKERRYFLPLFIAAIVISFSLLSDNKAYRFILPIFPFIAIMIAHSVEAVSQKWKTNLPWLLTLIFGVFQYLSINYRLFPQLAWISPPDGDARLQGIYALPKDAKDWFAPAREIVKLIQHNGGAKPVRIVLLSENWMNVARISYELKISGLYYILAREVDIGTDPGRDPLIQCEQFIQEAEFVLLEASRNHTNYQPRMLMRSFDRQRRNFSRLKHVTYPDKAEVSVYRRIS